MHMRAKTVIIGSAVLTFVFAGCDRDKAPTVQKKPQQNEATADATPTTWRYSEQQDEMGRGSGRKAVITSLNTVTFGFPYGNSHMLLRLEENPMSGRNVVLVIENGQFLSHRGESSVTVKFDDGSLQTFLVLPSGDGRSNVVAIDVDYDEFVAQLKAAKIMKIEAGFFQEGSRVFTFDVQGLNWKKSN
jgi:hypothetical protein